jgi:hypothetical protein
MLKHEVTDLADVDEAFRPFYLKTEAGYRLDREADLNPVFEKEHDRKLAEFRAGTEAQLTSMRADRNRIVMERTAHEIAAKLSPDYAEVLLPHICERLDAHEADGRLVVSAKNLPTLDHLVEEFRADPAFARVVRGASPAEQAFHARRVAETLGASLSTQSMTRAAFERLTPQQRSEHARAGMRISDG